ncbi:patatin-like phospholipase family protein [Planotetraspora sp. GP83]|uniref:patatin-like phospholipase family protein n=1 Tax=Planotetraspora sp. GP83 TaxID=3156264 RepID=UPI003516467A
MTVESAVVLGPGGPVGTAWLAGLAAGLRREGVDLGAADLIVGTSAGAIVGAILASGGDLDRLATLPEPTDPEDGVRTDPERLAEVFATLGDTGLERAEALRRIGRLAVTALTGGEEAAIARMRFLVGGVEWPDRPLLIPSVDAETGEAVIWDRYGAASLPEAVAAGIAFPGTAPPITIDGRRYIDGALRAGINVDLAGDAGVLIVAEPMAHMSGTNGVAAGERMVVRLVPDAEAIEAFGPDITNRGAWAPAYQAGVRQAPDAAERIRVSSLIM